MVKGYYKIGVLQLTVNIQLLQITLKNEQRLSDFFFRFQQNIGTLHTKIRRMNDYVKTSTLSYAVSIWLNDILENTINIPQRRSAQRICREYRTTMTDTTIVPAEPRLPLTSYTYVRIITVNLWEFSGRSYIIEQGELPQLTDSICHIFSINNVIGKKINK